MNILTKNFKLNMIINLITLYGTWLGSVNLFLPEITFGHWIRENIYQVIFDAFWGLAGIIFFQFLINSFNNDVLKELLEKIKI